MGTDIHAYVEYYDEDKDEWIFMTDEIFDNIYYDPDFLAKMKERGGITENDERMWGNHKTRCPIQQRWYDLFGKLADVRNGWGFAGTDSGDGFKPLIGSIIYNEDYTRGIPSDISEGVASVIEDEAVEDWAHHKHYLFLHEILELGKWTDMVTKRGVCSLDAYKKIEPGGAPEQYSLDVLGGKSNIVSQQTMDKYLSEGFPPDAESLQWYVRMSWKVNELNYFKSFLKDMFILYSHMIKKGITNMGHIRLVFWFDS